MPSVTRLAKDVAAKVWPAVTARSRQGWQWLSLRPRVVFWVGGLSIALAFLVFSGPTAAGAALLAWAALRQAATASDRHQEQTNADRLRRITESFSKAIEQIGSDKLEVRLGGIYALERLSEESPRDHWTVMENLTAFVRERTRPEAERLTKPLDQRVAERAYVLWEKARKPEGRSEEFWREAARLEEHREPPATDIAAALTVISRRSAAGRAREAKEEKVLDFQQAVLRHANLRGAHLDHADLRGAHLEHANLSGSHLKGANLRKAHLECADLSGSHLKGANLREAHLERAVLRESNLEEEADLRDAHLECADLNRANLKGAHLNNAHLECAILNKVQLQRAILRGAHLYGATLFEVHLTGADLSFAEVTQAQIDQAAVGDATTQLPDGLARPAHWTQPKRGAEPGA